jgi:CheY-like chemotaxis protein
MATILEILMIDSNPADARLAKEMFKDSRIHNNMTVVSDLKQTMACLRKEREFAQALSPDIIFLNLIVAVKDGFDIWKEILGDTTFSAIPLVLISLSEDEQNVLMRDHAANDIKPVCYI